MTTNQQNKTMNPVMSELLIWYAWLTKLLDYTKQLLQQGYHEASAMSTRMIQSWKDKRAETSTEFNTKKEFPAPSNGIENWIQEAQIEPPADDDVVNAWAEVPLPDPGPIVFSGDVNSTLYSPGR